MFSGNLPREVDPERGAVEQGEGHGGGEADHQATTSQVSGDMGGIEREEHCRNGK